MLTWSRGQSSRAGTCATSAARLKTGAEKCSSDSAKKNRPRDNRANESLLDGGAVAPGCGDGCLHGGGFCYLESMGEAVIGAQWERAAMMAALDEIVVRAA